MEREGEKCAERRQTLEHWKGFQIRQGQSSRTRGSLARKQGIWRRQACRGLDWYSLERKFSLQIPPLFLSSYLPSYQSLKGQQRQRDTISGAKRFPLPTQHSNRSWRHRSAPELTESLVRAGSSARPPARANGRSNTPTAHALARLPRTRGGPEVAGSGFGIWVRGWGWVVGFVVWRLVK
jgi:hypothetical protein